jgi:hypothetical protein
MPEKISPKRIALIQNQFLREKFLQENEATDTTYISNAVKQIIKNIVTQYPELTELVDLSILLDEAKRNISQQEVKQSIQQLIECLLASEFRKLHPDDTSLEILQRYLLELDSDDVRVDWELFEQNYEHEPKPTTRALNLFNTNNGLIALTAGGTLNVYGISNISTQGLNNIINVGLNSPLNITGGINIATGALNITGSLILSSLTGGVLTSSPTGVVYSQPTTNNAVQIGNITGTLTSIPVGNNGQVLIGASGAAPAFASLTSNKGTIIYSSGANSLNLDVNPNLSLTGTITAGTGIVVQSGGINATGPINFHSLTGPGAVTVSSTGLLGSAQASANGQLLLGVSGGLPFFTGLSSPANPSGAASMIYSSGANFLSLQSVPLFGNVIRVDWLNGNNATATVTNGLPFQTITGAMNAISTSGIASIVNPVVVWVMPGIYNETVTMQAYVSLLGMTQGAGAEAAPTAGVIIQQLSVSTNTTLVTMADYSRLENVSLNITTGTSAVNLIGISFPSSNTAAATARVQNVMLTVNNSGTTSGSQTTYGISCLSTGAPLLEIPVVRDSTIYVNSSATSSGQVAGIFINAGTNSEGLTIQDCNINVAVSGSLTTTTPAALLLQTGICNITDSTLTITSSAVGAIGISVATSGDTCNVNSCYTSATCTTTGTLLAYGIDVVAGATCTANNTSISGTNTVTAANGNDITNAGTLNLYSSALTHGTANNTNFTSVPSSLLNWTSTGAAFTSTSNLQLMIGGGNAGGGATYGNAYYTAARNLTLKNLHVQTNGTISSTKTFTVYTGATVGTAVASSVTCTVPSSGASASDTTHSVAVTAGQIFFMIMSGPSTSVANPVVLLEMY